MPVLSTVGTVHCFAKKEQNKMMIFFFFFKPGESKGFVIRGFKLKAVLSAFST